MAELPASATAATASCFYALASSLYYFFSSSSSSASFSLLLRTKQQPLSGPISRLRRLHSSRRRSVIGIIGINQPIFVFWQQTSERKWERDTERGRGRGEGAGPIRGLVERPSLAICWQKRDVSFCALVLLLLFKSSCLLCY